VKKLAIFASGTGSNAQKIIDYFREHDLIEVSLIVSNKPKAGVLEIAQKEDIPFIVLSRDSFYKTQQLVQQLQTRQIDLIILAGFLWLVPDYLVKAFSDAIINIHPALLPKYGGKGMYGMHVHEAVKKNEETESGITIHYVNEHYDEGQIIKQVVCPLSQNDSPQEIRNKVLVLEHYHYPRVIEALANSNS
jgi:phosphoribosylglycinamide formyltransferase-1